MTHPHIASNGFGIFAWFGLQTPFVERMCRIREAGFSSTSLWWEEEHPVRRELRYQAPEKVREAGLGIHSIHVPYRRCNQLWDPDPTVCAEAVSLHARWLDDCARFEVPMMVMHATLGNEPPPPNDAGIDSFRRIVEIAEDLGVTVAVENTRSDGHISALFEQISSPFLGLCYDSSHDWLHSKEPFRLLRQWEHRIVATHWSDTDGILDRHWIPGDGSIDFDSLADAIDWPGLNCHHLLEVFSRDRTVETEAFLNRAFMAAERLSSRLRLNGRCAAR